MLTKDLLRYRLRDGRLHPLLLKATPAVLRLVEDLLAHWARGVGGRRGELEEAAQPILHASRALVVARGLQKLILDRCRFADPASAEHLRSEAFAASAALLAAPATTMDAHRAAVAERLGLSDDVLGERLYGDLPDFAVLEATTDETPEQLIARYNLALCQGLLLHARRLRATVRDADTGARRRLLKALRFQRLLAEIAQDGDGALTLAISGPGSVLDQSTRYGLQLALFLPALACARLWHMEADIAAPRGGGEAVLELSDELGLPGATGFLGFVPEELRELHDQLAAKRPDWRFAEPQLLPLPGGELVAPDLQIDAGGTVVAVELFHRWHGHALARRIEQLGRGLAPRLVLGVDRALAKRPEHAALLATPAFLRQGFLFSEIPSLRALQEAIERVRAAPP